MRLNSLRARLLLSTVLLVAVVLPATAFVLTSYYQSAIEQSFDARLRLHLDNLIASSLREPVLDQPDADRPPIELGDPLFNRPFSGWYWQIRQLGSAEESAAGSESLLDQSLAALPATNELDADDTARGYIHGPDNQLLRVMQREIIVESEDGTVDGVAEGEGGQQAEGDASAVGGSPAAPSPDVAKAPAVVSSHYLYSVAGLADEVEGQVRDFRNMLLLALGLLGTGLVVVGVLQVGYGLRPLGEMSQQLNEIRVGKADRLAGEFPSEIEPLQQELNALLRANRDIVERARTHVGNLAHALKTPLSVIGNEVDRARKENGEARALAEIVGRQAELMSDQVRHHLDRARVAAQRGVIGSSTEVDPALRALVRTLEKIHQQRGLRIEVSSEPDLLFRGERHDFEEMLGNLLDNAFKWARGTVRLRVEPAKGRTGLLSVTVEDDGPGLSAEKRARALKRGQRLDEALPGSGLGLSIVADLAHLYGGKFDLGQSELGGLRAALLLPCEER